MLCCGAIFPRHHKATPWLIREESSPYKQGRYQLALDRREMNNISGCFVDIKIHKRKIMQVICVTRWDARDLITMRSYFTITKTMKNKIKIDKTQGIVNAVYRYIV